MDKRGLTQMDIQRQTGIAQRTLSNFVTSDTHPSFATLVTLHARYGVSVDWLLGLDGPKETERIDRLLTAEGKLEKITKAME